MNEADLDNAIAQAEQFLVFARELKTGFEKCYSSGVHQMDAIRTIISFEKAKMNIL